MKKSFSMVVIVLFFSVVVSAQDENAKKAEGNTYTLKSKTLEQRGKELDSQIEELTGKISGIIKEYDLMKIKNIKILPYQTTYKLGDDFIEIERYNFKKDSIYSRSVTGIRSKSMKLYTSGDNITRIVSRVYENNQYSEIVTEVIIEDPSPGTAGTDDIKFTHMKNKYLIVKDKPLGKVKNTTAFPLRNDIKSDFIIPHLTYFYNSLLFIAESYHKSLKDSDGALREFLTESSEY